MPFEIKSKDKGWAKLLATVQKLKAGKIEARAGVIGKNAEAEHSGGLTNVALAAIHEFGSPAVHIPERSFIRAPFDANREKYQKQLAALCAQVLGGSGDLEKGMNAIGFAMVSDMRHAITEGEGIPPPLKPATIEAKGSSRPLVDTGQLLRSITHAVVVPGSGDKE